MGLIFSLLLFIEPIRNTMLLGLAVYLLSFMPDSYLKKYGLFVFSDTRRWLGLPTGWIIMLFPVAIMVTDLTMVLLGIWDNFVYHPTYPTVLDLIGFGFGIWVGKNWCPIAPPQQDTTPSKQAGSTVNNS